MNQKQPRGPQQLNPIQGMREANSYKDFRPNPAVQSAKKVRKQTAFESELAKSKATAEAKRKEIDEREPVTGFQKEVASGGRPLGAVESAPRSDSVDKEKSEAAAVAEKANQPQPQKVPPRPSTSDQKSGQS